MSTYPTKHRSKFPVRGPAVEFCERQTVMTLPCKGNIARPVDVFGRSLFASDERDNELHIWTLT